MWEIPAGKKGNASIEGISEIYFVPLFVFFDASFREETLGLEKGGKSL